MILFWKHLPQQVIWKNTTVSNKNFPTSSIHLFTGQISDNFNYHKNSLIISCLESEVAYFENYGRGSSFQLKLKQTIHWTFQTQI